MEGLYKLNVKHGRKCWITGMFLADSEDVERLIGMEAYFGEICGKHSEIMFAIESEHIELVSTEPSVLDLGEAICCGYDPFEYAPCCARCPEMDCEWRGHEENDGCTPMKDCVWAQENP